MEVKDIPKEIDRRVKERLHESIIAAINVEHQSICTKCAYFSNRSRYAGLLDYYIRLQKIKSFAKREYYNACYKCGTFNCNIMSHKFPLLQYSRSIIPHAMHGIYGFSHDKTIQGYVSFLDEQMAKVKENMTPIAPCEICNVIYNPNGKLKYGASII